MSSPAFAPGCESGANQGKDFVAGFIAVRAFLLHAWRPGGCRIITTSVKDDHLRVLWGEISRFVQTSAYPLTKKDGGNLLVKHRDIRWVNPDTGEVNPISYLRGMVSERGEGMAGHHAAHTYCILDEASGIDDSVYDQVRTWAKRILVIGNCNATTNFFYRGVKGGDIIAGDTRTLSERIWQSGN